MKIRNIVSALLVLFASAAIAQEQHTQDLPQQPLDSESGWKLIRHSDFGLGALKFPTKDTGYLVTSNDGTNLIQLCSTNGGVTWDSISSEFHGTPHYLNSLIGYTIIGSNNNPGKFWKTQDGGRTWKSYDTPARLYGQVDFFDNDTGVTLGIGRSTDGGETWTPIFLKGWVGDKQSEIGIANKKVAYIVGDYVTLDTSHQNSPGGALVLKTSDAGLTWNRIPNNIHDKFYGCQVFDEQTIYAFSYENFYRSINGGISWDSIRIVGVDGILAMSFINKGQGMLAGGAGNSGVAFSTNDSGKTWQKQVLPPNLETVRGIVMLNDSIAYAVTTKNLYVTTTGGQPSTVHQHIIDFHVQTFPNPTPGLITIQYQLPTASTVSFRFFDLQGQTLSVINPGIQEAGLHQIQYDGTSLSNGMYFFQLSTPVDSYTGQFSILK